MFPVPATEVNLFDPGVVLSLKDLQVGNGIDVRIK